MALTGGKILSHYYLIHTKSNTGWLGIEPVTQRSERPAVKSMNHVAAPKYVSVAPALVSVRPANGLQFGRLVQHSWQRLITNCETAGCLPDSSRKQQATTNCTLHLIIIIIIIIYAIQLSLGGSSPYTSTDKTNKNKYT